MDSSQLDKWDRQEAQWLEQVIYYSDRLRKKLKLPLGDLREDWQGLLEALEPLRQNEPVEPIALDVVCLPKPTLLQPLLLRLGLERPRFTGVSYALNQYVSYRARQAIEVGNGQEAVELLSRLLSLAESRLGKNNRRYRYLVNQCLNHFLFVAPEIARNLARESEPYFGSDTAGAEFYYFSGELARLDGSYADSLVHHRHSLELYLRHHPDCHYLVGRQELLCAMLDLLVYQKEKQETALDGVLRKVEEGYYAQSEQLTGLYYLGLSVLLESRCERRVLREELPRLEKLLAFCREQEENVRHPLLTQRHALMLLGNYYLEIGELLTAAEYGERTVRTLPPAGVELFPGEPAAYGNLLIVYTALNDSEQTSRILEILEDRREEWETDPWLCQRLELLIREAERNLDEYEAEPWEAERVVKETLEKLRRGTWQPEFPDVEFLRVSDFACELLNEADAQRWYSPVAELYDLFSRQPQYAHCNDRVKCILTLRRSGALILLGDPGTLAVTEEACRLLPALRGAYAVHTSFLAHAARQMLILGKPERMEALVLECLSVITETWQSNAAWLNDNRLAQSVRLVQVTFLGCYDLLKRIRTPEQRYELVLRFKAMADLAGRERNRILRLEPVDEALRREIFRLQDTIAGQELSGEEDPEQQIRLQELEAEFARKFPKHREFTPISLARLQEALPADGAVLEYHQTFELEGDDLRSPLEVYVVRKDRLQLLTIPDGDSVLAAAEELVRRVQEQDTGNTNELYRTLIAPVEEALEGVRTLYLAPDHTFSNLPFEILADDQGRQLQDRYFVCRLVCGRDLLMPNDTPPAPGSFVLGDPDYGRETPSQERGTVGQLPFSGLEARQVAKRCRTTACTGRDATKFALQKALPVGVIHLATHGTYLPGENYNNLYDSQLVFAGYNREESPEFGNGILTADEISRMDLRGTELVVLSACQSGLGQNDHLVTQGLISAFSAAGVRWVISCMWSANDLTTPILMDTFYRAWRGGLDVPEALAYAKDVLRTITAKQLRDSGWLDALWELADRPMREELERIRTAPDGRRFFANEYYWGGFICHKSR